jgi:Brp/Blh family beta-carotene 15,15'-monooxygenase
MKYENSAIILTFFSLWLSVYFTNPSQELIALFLIFSFGILHGSNDLSLIAKVSNASKPLHLALFIGSYVLTVLVASLLFYFIPIIALIVFVFFSAFHFGEQHWSASLNNSPRLNKFFFLNYGLALLFLLFYLNREATQDIVFSLTKLRFPEQWVLWIFIVSSSLWLAQALLLLYRKRISLQQLIFEVFMFLVFAIVFKTATLIWAFAIYFIFWHSIPSILEQQSFLYGEVSFRTFVTYVKSSFFIWLVSIVSIVLLFFWLEDEAVFLPVLFAFLGAITFAHSFTISKMFRLKK